jgi:hypothetical protein
MRISQVGEPSVCLSFDSFAEAPQGAGFVGINLPVKVEGRAEEDGPLVAETCLSGRLRSGKVVEKKPRGSWLVFRIPRDLCSEGSSLTLRVLVDEVVLWQRSYRVVWRGRFPGLHPTA